MGQRMGEIGIELSYGRIDDRRRSGKEGGRERLRYAPLIG